MNTRPGTPVARRSLAWLVSVVAAGLTRVAHRGFARPFGGRAVLTIVASGLFAATAVAQYPIAGLIQGTDGNLYGTTSGAAFGMGTIFKIDTNGTTFTTLHSFGGSDGANPLAGLVQGTDGNLYGTTDGGGASGMGTIFKIDTNGTTLTTLHSFGGGDGANPLAGLVQGTDGNLYGTTFMGGSVECGTWGGEGMRDDLQDRHERHNIHYAALLSPNSGALPRGGVDPGF